MKRLAVWIGMAAGAIILTMASAGYERMSSDHILFEGVEPGFDSIHVIVGGWPMPYLYDNPGISVVGSVGFVQGLTGDDDFRTGAFLADAGFYLVILLGAAELVRRRRRQLRESH